MPPRPARLAGRLREITAVEQLRTDLSALLALCKKTDNDIRSCLSTLQFFRWVQLKLLNTSLSTSPSPNRSLSPGCKSKP